MNHDLHKSRMTIIWLGAVSLLMTVSVFVYWHNVKGAGVVYLGGEILEMATSSPYLVIYDSRGHVREVVYTEATRFIARKKEVSLENLIGKPLSIRAHYNVDGQLEAEIIRVIGKSKH